MDGMAESAKNVAPKRCAARAWPMVSAANPIGSSPAGVPAAGYSRNRHRSSASTTRPSSRCTVRTRPSWSGSLVTVTRPRPSGSSCDGRSPGPVRSVTRHQAAGEVSASNSSTQTHSPKSIPAAGLTRMAGLSSGSREPVR